MFHALWRLRRLCRLEEGRIVAHVSFPSSMISDGSFLQIRNFDQAWLVLYVGRLFLMTFVIRMQ